MPSLGAEAQVIRISDRTSGLPVVNVAVFNRAMNRSVITDQDGKASLDIFSPVDTVFLQHPSYKRISICIADLGKTGFQVFLDRDVRLLNEIVLAVNRWEQEKNEVPNKISILSRRDIEINNPQTAADLLGIDNSVFLQKSQLGGGSPMIRGFAANSVLLVVDGVRLNNAIYRSGNLQNVISLDPNIIEQAEVVYGPGSVIYGSDALGGVMDFHSLSPKLSTSNNIFFSTTALTRFSSANNERLGHLDMNIGLKKWAFLGSISYSSYSDLLMGRKGPDSYLRKEYVARIDNRDTILLNKNPLVQKSSGYSQLNLSTKIRFMPREKVNLNYSFHYSGSSDIPRYDRLIQYKDEQLKYADWYYGPQKWLMHSLNGNFEKKTGFYDNSKFTIAYQNYQESRHSRKLHENILSHRFEEVDIFSANLDMNKKLGDSLTAFYGLEGIFNNVTSVASGENIDNLTSPSSDIPVSSRYPDGLNHYYSMALYSILKYNFNEKYTLNTGLRYNYVYLHSTIEDNSFYNLPFDNILLDNGAFNTSLGLVYRQNENSQLNINLASGFRAPNIDDVAKIFDSEPGNVVVPNENLEPEYSYNIDLGWIKKTGDIADIEITAFYTFLENVMLRREFDFNGQDSIMYDGEISKVYAVVNAGKARIYGFNLDMKLYLSSLVSLKSDITFIKGRDNKQLALRHVPPIYGGIHLLFEKEKLNANLSVLYNGKLSNKNLAPEEQSKSAMYELDDQGKPYSPSWYTLNLKTAFRPNEKVSIFLGIDNILNYRYRPYSSGIVSPGRNFFFSLKYSIS